MRRPPGGGRQPSGGAPPPPNRRASLSSYPDRLSPSSGRRTTTGGEPSTGQLTAPRQPPHSPPSDPTGEQRLHLVVSAGLLVIDGGVARIPTASNGSTSPLPTGGARGRQRCAPDPPVSATGSPDLPAAAAPGHPITTGAPGRARTTTDAVSPSPPSCSH
jgi:hypothetical protein